jgi:hypothetical protein
MTDDQSLCVCGHTAHWHAENGSAECEHDGDCRCRAFWPTVVPAPPAENAVTAAIGGIGE